MHPASQGFWLHTTPRRFESGDTKQATVLKVNPDEAPR